SDFRSLISQGADVIVGYADAGDALLPAVREATKRHIPFSTYVGGVIGTPGTDYTTVLQQDLCGLGKQFAAIINTQVKTGQVAFLGGTPGNTLTPRWQDCEKAALAKTIDFVGGTIAADATFEATLVSCSVLSRNTNTCLELLPEVVIQPSFPDAELTKTKDRLIGQIRQRLDDAGQLASAHVQNLLWSNDHVRGWINSEAAVQALRRDDVVAWHKTWFVPGNAMLVVSGDVDSKKLKADLERSFGVWPKGPTPPTPQYPEPGLSGIRIRVVDKPGQTQTHIRVAQFGIRHEDPRFFDTLVWNYALGGGAFSSRLMKVVRIAGGKTYSASSSFDRNLDRGSFVASTFTRNAEAVATTKLVLGEIAKMQKDGPSQDELNAAIANIAGGYGLRFQSAADVGAALVGAELHNFGIEYLTNYPLAVGKVDVNSAKAAAQGILDPKNYVVVMVGDAKDLEPQLKKEGWRYEKVSFTEPVTPEVKATDAPIDAKSAAVVKKLVDDAIAAKGGAAKLATIKGIKMTAKGTTTIGPKTIPVEVERVYLLPDKMRIDAKLTVPGPDKTPQQVSVIVAAEGKAAWQIGPDADGKPALSDLTGAQLAQVDFERWREPELVLLKAADKNAKIALQPDENIDGKPQSVFKLAAPVGNIDVTIYLDKKTKLITRMLYSDSGVSNTDDFADYKEQDGLQVAHKRTSVAAGRTTALTISKVEIDPKVDAKLFSKPKAP
ncbi:MAG TPA: insulinase family protein, partial [Kofleriaceae bacterium]|nr:insulinase family protein [Kofleriaceae bacterium]